MEIAVSFQISAHHTIVTSRINVTKRDQYINSLHDKKHFFDRIDSKINIRHE